jgi:hypothetical protein
MAFYSGEGGGVSDTYCETVNHALAENFRKLNGFLCL